MSESEPKRQESIAADRLPPAIGVDADGLVHRAPARFAHAVVLTDGEGRVVATHDLDGRRRETWVEFVAERRGWTDCWADELLTPGEIERRITAALGGGSR